MTSSDIKEISDDSVDGGRRDVRGGRDASFKIKLFYDGAEHALAIKDPIVDGRKIRRLAGLEPADDYVLIRLMHPGTRSIGLDEDVDLRDPGSEEFWAFQADRTFNFTVAELGYEWGEADISQVSVRYVADVPEEKVLVLERADEPDDELEDDAVINLAERGTEHFRIENHPDTFEIKVIYNGVDKKLKVSLSELIGNVLQRAIAAFGNLPQPHTLALYNKAGRELPDGETVKQAKVKKGDKLLLRPSTVKAG